MQSPSVAVSCLVAVACLLPAALWAYPSGAPVGVCNSELPKHGGAEPQATQSPYAIQATPTSINQGGRVTVQVYGSTPFKGVILTARDVHTSQLLQGTFTPDAQTKTLDCPGGNANAITHNSRDEKTQVVVTWTAPAGYTGQVYFSATVVQSSYVFWKGITSDAVFVQ
ncbi:defense protein l(2)34Fc-like [Dermacentor variabilis]|uniref:defense protein l(2)34Fc-like n=1 Tax=Dermacentor variabilis TaxID=34621 RepID=UPI003F5AFC87